MDLKLASISDLIEELYDRCTAQEGACFIACIHQGDDLTPPSPDKVVYLTTTRVGAATQESYHGIIDMTRELLQEVIKAR